MLRNLLLVLVLLLPLSMMAQSEEVRRRLQRADSVRRVADSVIAGRYRDSRHYDTLYIRRPPTRWTIKLRANVSGASLRVGSIKKYSENHGHIQKDVKGTIAIAANYMGIGAGLALNPGKLLGKKNYTDIEFNLNSYSNRYGFDIVFSKADNYSGTFRLDGTEHDVERKMIKMEMLNINAYYAFNGRRFSFPAAFTQSYLQVHSAGSWLVGVSFMGCVTKLHDTDIAHFDNARVYLGNFSVGGGYGYNLVTRHRWLFHLSALPTLVVINRNNMKVEDGDKTRSPFSFPDFILTERAAVVHDFTDNWFASGTLVMNNSIFGKPDKLFMGFNKWRVRIALGRRL